MTDPLVRNINRYLRKQGSPLAGRGAMFVKKGRKYGVDPRLLVAIAGAETSFGKAGRGPAVNNYWGIGPGRSYPSVGAGTDYLARLLRHDYLDQGLTTIDEISGRYVHGNVNDPAPGWAKNVSTFFQALGGSGSLLYKGGTQDMPRSSRGAQRAAQKGTRPAKTYTNLPDILAQREGARDDLFDSLRAQSRARMAGQPSDWGDLSGKIDALKEAEQRKPTVVTIGKPARASKQANKGKPTYAQDGVSVIGNFTMGGGPDAHGSRPLGNWQSDHAWDLMAAPGTPIYAAVDGIIDPNAGFGFSSNGSTVWGNRLTLRGEGNAFFYTHLGKIAKGVKPGRRVKRGQLIGWVGKPPGFAPHLHIGLQHGDLSDYMNL